MVRLAEGDERIAPPVRMVLHGVKARTYAALGEPDACRRHVDLAERESSNTDAAEPGWLGQIAGPAQLAATTGHALAQLAMHTGQAADRSEAADRLAAAIAGLDPTTHARARALCQARLAALRLAAGDLDGATGPAYHALQAVEQIRSARLTHAIVELRDTAAGHPDRTEATSLIEAIDAGIGPPGEDPAVLGSHQQA